MCLILHGLIPFSLHLILPPKQQEKDKALRARLSELNATSKIYKIKNGEIVRRENQ